MVEDALDDFGPNPLPLIGFVDDHIPDGGAVDKIGEYSAKPNELITVPGAQSHIGVTQHFLRVIKRSVLRPRCLVE